MKNAESWWDSFHSAHPTSLHSTPPNVLQTRLYNSWPAEENSRMGRERKRDASSTTTPSQNPNASPRSHARPGKGRSLAADTVKGNPWAPATACILLLVSTLLAFRPAFDKDFDFVNLDD